MGKKTLKWLLAIGGLLLIAAAIFLVNLIWFRPWSLNLFYEKVFALVLFEEPELLSSVNQPIGFEPRRSPFFLIFVFSMFRDSVHSADVFYRQIADRFSQQIATRTDCV
jgi:hypothetical protein